MKQFGCKGLGYIEYIIWGEYFADYLSWEGIKADRRFLTPLRQTPFLKEIYEE